MKFKTHRDNIPFVPSSRVGRVITTYKDIISTFGEPLEGDNDKTDAEWELLFEDGTDATIYNYKDGKNYLGDEGQEVEEITDWHIGGSSIESLNRVTEVLNCKLISQL